MAKGKQIPYTSAELAWIEQNRTLPRREACELFREQFQRDDVTFDLFKALCTRKGWATGRTGQIVKGTTPWNKGREWAEGEGGKHPNARKTQFKQGHEPHNTQYLGHERVTKDGYVEISIDEENPYTGYERRYELKHKYLWEQANGRVPEGTCLKCLDGNRQNTDPRKLDAHGARSIALPQRPPGSQLRPDAGGAEACRPGSGESETREERRGERRKDRL